MEYRLVPLELLKRLHKLADEEYELNLRCGLEEVIKGPTIDLEDIRKELKEIAKIHLAESEFFL